jgi:hypothetical protein
MGWWTKSKYPVILDDDDNYDDDDELSEFVITIIMIIISEILSHLYIWTPSEHINIMSVSLGLILF